MANGKSTICSTLSATRPGMPDFEIDVSRMIWDSRYRYRDGATTDSCIGDSWRRVARALASVEPKRRKEWEARFLELLEDF